MSARLQLKHIQKLCHNQSISRAAYRPQAEVYLFTIRDPIPAIPIPLRADETEPWLALNQIVHDLYERAGYDLVIDYQHQTSPPLAKEDMLWLKQRLQLR